MKSSVIVLQSEPHAVGGYNTGFQYNNDGLLQSAAYPEGNSVTYTYDSSNSQTRSKANLLSITENPGPRGTSDPAEFTRTTTFTYETYCNQVTSVTSPNGLTVTNTNADENGNFQSVDTNVPGISYSYSYTENGRLKTETNPSGLTTTYQYQNGNGYLNRISSPFETENFNQYDDVGNLLNYSNSRGITSTYTVNQFSEVTSETASAEGSLSPLNYSASYSYFKDGNLQSQDTIFGTGDGAVQNSSNYTYDARDNLLTETESARGTTNYTYDGNDNLTSISSGSDYMSFNYDDRNMPSTFLNGQGANAGAYSFTYDGNGNMVTSTDPYGHVTSYQHDGYDRVKTITDPLGNASIISRAEFGNLLTIKNIASSGEVLRETARVNDPLGRMMQYTVKVPGGADEIYNYTYADGGKTVTITDSLNRLWTVKKNDFGQVYEETNPAGNKTAYFYLDGRGNMTKKIETEKRPDGTDEIHTTEYRYNAFNKIEEIKENVGTAAEAVTTLTYDFQGNLDGSIDGEGNTISHKYDSLGRKIRTKKHFKDGTAVTTDFTYYANNLLKTIKDSKGNTTAYEYDDQKRLTKIIYPDNSFSQYTYTTATVDNKVYRSVVEKQRNGTVVTSLFDELNRLKSRNISPAQGIDGVTAETYEYDALSRVTRAVGDNFTVARKYDSLNRVNQENQMGNLIQYTHSVVDNRRKMAVQYSQGRIFERDFDILDRISKLSLVSVGRESIADFSYIGKAYRMLSKQCGNGDAIDFVYDQGRRLNTKETKNRNQGLINKYIYGYNRVGMKMFEQRGHDGNKGDAFAYDEVYRLTGVKFNSPEPANPATELFEKRWASQLDKVDNILKIVRQTESGTSEIVTTIEGVNAQLNQYTRFDEWGLSYDLNGNTTQRGTQHITYDYRNRIVSVQGLGVAVNYNYDPFNRRVEKILGSGTVKYLYDGDQVIEERDGNDNILRQYVWGNGVDELIAIYIKDGDTFKVYYPHTNGSGSITAITDDQGEVIERVTYDVYGMPTFLDANNQPLANNQSTIGNNYLFQGREYDKETNLYYYRARYYDPIMGRFLQTDPMGYEDSMNLYQAMNMNPVNFMDPMGEYFVIPEDDSKRDRILKALAAGSLTAKGSVIFWELFNDPRPITIHSGELETNLRPIELVQKSNTINFLQTYGAVDTNKAFRNWSTDKKIKDLDITVSFRNLDNYFLTQKRFGYVFNNQGKLDQEGVTTIYHELTHAKDFFDLNGNLGYLGSASKVREGDYKIDSSGNIIEPRIYSHHSRAQLFGESVFEQTKNLGINKKEKKNKIDAVVTLILVKMTERGEKK